MALRDVLIEDIYNPQPQRFIHKSVVKDMAAVYATKGDYESSNASVMEDGSGKYIIINGWHRVLALKSVNVPTVPYSCLHQIVRFDVWCTTRTYRASCLRSLLTVFCVIAYHINVVDINNTPTAKESLCDELLRMFNRIRAGLNKFQVEQIMSKGLNFSASKFNLMWRLANHGHKH